MNPTPLLAVLLASLLPAAAAIKSGPVEYKQGEVTLEGWQAHDDARPGPRPGILVVHQWKGLSAYERKRAEMFAQLGYNVLSFCFQDSPRRAHSIAAQGGINAASQALRTTRAS